MKIAGQKNPGAWNRVNKWLQTLSPAERTAIQQLVEESEYVEAAFGALQDLATETGFQGLTGAPATTSEFVAHLLTNGIPLQVWMGKLTFTTYAEGAGGKRTANYQSQIHYFAKDLRKIMKRSKAADREIRDLFDLGTAKQNNPSGNPDGPYKGNGG